MAITKIVERRPLNFSATYSVADEAANATHLYMWVAGVTDLTVFIENAATSDGITISIDWAMDDEGHGGTPAFIDAIGSDPTLAAGNYDHWRFGSSFPLYTTDVLVDPYFENVLPCNWIRITLYATLATESADVTVWLQGHRQRL